MSICPISLTRVNAIPYYGPCYQVRTYNIDRGENRSKFIPDLISGKVQYVESIIKGEVCLYSVEVTGDDEYALFCRAIKKEFPVLSKIDVGSEADMHSIADIFACAMRGVLVPELVGDYDSSLKEKLSGKLEKVYHALRIFFLNRPEENEFDRVLSAAFDSLGSYVFLMELIDERYTNLINNTVKGYVK